MNRRTSHIVFVFVIFLFLVGCKDQKSSPFSTIGYLVKIDDDFDKIVPSSTVIEVIASGLKWSEGPVWVEEKQWLLFSDVPENIVYKWTETKGLEKFLEPSGYSGSEKGVVGSNGLTLDLQGKLILCKSGDREISRLTSWDISPSPQYQTIANGHDGLKFNRPNDIIIDKAGNFYFTDPNFGMKDSGLQETDYQGVYKIDTDGKVHLLSKSCATPNGIGLSPDEKTLYVANTRPPALYAWDVVDDHTITNQRVVHDLQEIWENSVAKQFPDGMAINKEGIIFMTGPDGVFVYSPDEKHLGTIRTDKLTSNCAFNDDETILYVTCDDLILRINLKSDKKK